MKLLTIAIIFLTLFFYSFQDGGRVKDNSPLAVFSPEWNDLRFEKCYTARSTNYLTTEEKDVIHILNLVRTDPKLFERTVLQNYPAYVKRLNLNNVPEFSSLVKTLKTMEAAAILTPDEKCFESAKCHAISSGKKGYVGHNRLTSQCKDSKHFGAECCNYGHSKALDIVISLLIDQGVPSLGHREICLGNYSRIGVSIQPHEGYGYNSVLDFN